MKQARDNYSMRKLTREKFILISLPLNVSLGSQSIGLPVDEISSVWISATA